MSDDDVKEVSDLFDVGVDEAASIWFARCSTLGYKTNQLQTCNWLVIAPNWGGISSSFSRSIIKWTKLHFIIIIMFEFSWKYYTIFIFFLFFLFLFSLILSSLFLSPFLLSPFLLSSFLLSLLSFYPFFLNENRKNIISIVYKIFITKYFITTYLKDILHYLHLVYYYYLLHLHLHLHLQYLRHLCLVQKVHFLSLSLFHFFPYHNRVKVW